MPAQRTSLGRIRETPVSPRSPRGIFVSKISQQVIKASFSAAAVAWMDSAMAGNRTLCPSMSACLLNRTLGSNCQTCLIPTQVGQNSKCGRGQGCQPDLLSSEGITILRLFFLETNHLMQEGGKKNLHRKRQMTAQDPKRQVLRHFVIMPGETVLLREPADMENITGRARASDAGSMAREPQARQEPSLIFQ